MVVQTQLSTEAGHRDNILGDSGINGTYARQGLRGGEPGPRGKRLRGEYPAMQVVGGPNLYHLHMSVWPMLLGLFRWKQEGGHLACNFQARSLT